MKSILLICACLLIAAPAWGNIDSSLDEIEQLIRLRDYSEAVKRLKPLAAAGAPEAQFRLAGLYRSGKGVGKDLDKATELYHESAIAGHAEAQYAFAVIIEKSSNTPASRNEARRWYRQSAAQGNERASIKLSELRDSPDVELRSISRSELFNAIQHNDEALIYSLTSRNFNFNLTDRQGNSTVLAALLAGWPRMAGTLIPRSQNLEQENVIGNLPLHIATARGYKEIVVDLLDSNVDINQQDLKGDTALILAVKGRKTEIAEVLLERGADHALTNKKKQSAANLAYAAENSAMKGLFANYGIKAQAVARKKAENTLDTFKVSVAKHGARYSGWPMLNIAIELGDTKIANQLLAQKPELKATDPDGNGAQHVAARKGDAEILKKLVARGADVNAVNKRNETALYLAVESDSVKSVKLLLSNNADPSIETRLEVTPLEVAIQNNRFKIALTLLKTRSSYPGIHRALLLAIERRMENLSNALIKRDKNLSLLDDKQRSVLWHSVDRGLAKTSALLVASGEIDLTARDVNGHSALAQAVIRGHSKIVRLLDGHGGNLAERTNEGNTMIMLAVLSKSRDIVQFLLDRNIEAVDKIIDLNAQDNVGETALMMAAATAQDRVIEMLLLAGADPQLRNKEELNAFQIAINAGHGETARFIHDKSNFIFKLFN